MDNQIPNNKMNGSTQTQEPMKFCKYCGKKIAEKAVICPLCGCQVEQFNNNQAQQPIVINNTNNNVSSSNAIAGGVYSRPKNKWVALILCIFLGFFGVHKFYEEKAGMGILYFFTAGLFGIGWIIDIICLIFKPITYYV